MLRPLLTRIINQSATRSLHYQTLVPCSLYVNVEVDVYGQIQGITKCQGQGISTKQC